MDYKFNIGDKVYIKDEPTCRRIVGFTGGMTSDMGKYCNKEYTIRRRFEIGNKPAYRLADAEGLSSAGDYSWDERALEFANCFDLSSFKPIATYAVIDKPTLKYNIKKVIFNNPATIVLWNDGTKTVVKAQGDDVYDKEKGFALCIAKKCLGNKGNFNNEFKKWLGDK